VAIAFLNRLIAPWTESSLWNPVSLAPAIGLLLGVAFLAIMIPARRAASSDPMDALHAES
jgi:ABC-type antimicrobial peptide transport system permease subunit